MDIIVNDYKEYFCKDRKGHNDFTNWIRREIVEQLINFKGTKIELYNLMGEYHTHNTGKKNKLFFIFANATRKGASNNYKFEGELLINGKNYNKDNRYTGKHFLGIAPRGKLILSDNGVPLAQYEEDKYQLNILFDVADNFDDEMKEVFSYILVKLNDIFEESLYDISWKLTKNKNGIIENIKNEMKSGIEDIRRNLTVREEDLNNRIKRLTRDLKESYDSIGNVMYQLNSLKDNRQEIVDKVVKDLDLIIQNEHIEDIFIEDGKYIFKTKELVIYDDRGRMWKGGKFEVTLNVNNSEVRFKGTEKRRGYWSGEDPHPHISKDGTACLGNVLTTIVELCSQYELYALVLVILDFLQSANTNDPAGERVTNWQRIDENGSEIEHIDEDDITWTCDCCGEGMTDDECSNTAYADYDWENGVLGDEVMVCDACLRDNFTFFDDADEYIRD